MIDLAKVYQPVSSFSEPPQLQGVLKAVPEDFYVEEQLGFSPEGEGEHVYIYVEKTGQNTQYVADQLASFAGVATKHVSFSGMKDRWAVTRQWFGVHLPGKETPNFKEAQFEGVNILVVSRHPRKLRRGVHRSNFFNITLRDIQGDKADFEKRLHEITRRGFPNYFGEQRFGHQGKNLRSAERWFTGQFKPRRNQRGIFLSAARAYLFNRVLNERLAKKLWLSPVDGDYFMLEGTQSVFQADLDDSILQRLEITDIHITGPLVGRHKDGQQATACFELEQGVIQAADVLQKGLLENGLSAERRALRVVPKRVRAEFTEKSLSLSFELPRGSFATAMLAELLQYQTHEYQV